MRPVRIESDTRAAFRIPSGLQSGLYAVALRYSATQWRSDRLYMLVLQQEIGGSQFARVEPSDGIVTENFHGQLNATLKARSESSADDLPMLDLLAGSTLAEVTGLSLGCELVFGPTASCPGRAEQRSREEYTCHIDLRECPDRVQGASLVPASPFREARLAFTLVIRGEGAT